MPSFANLECSIYTACHHLEHKAKDPCLHNSRRHTTLPTQLGLREYLLLTLHEWQNKLLLLLRDSGLRV